MNEAVTTKHGVVQLTETVRSDTPGHHVANMNGKWIGSVVVPPGGGSYLWVSCVLARKGRVRTLKEAATALAAVATERWGG